MPENQLNFLTELKRRKVFRVAVAYVVIAWVALQFLDLVFENINAPDWVMLSVMAIMAVGFPVALVLAWAFDVSSEGVQTVPGRSRAFVLLIAVVSVASLGYVGWMYIGSAGDEIQADSTASGSEISVIDSIAVLPFESFSEDPQDAYFADGLADTLLHKLANLSNLKVIARNSSFQFKGSNKDAREIGRILGVAALLEGSVQRQGEQMRIIAQLIDTSNGTHIWSSTFDDTFQNIFELQDRIAQEIMQQLQISISERDMLLTRRNGTDSPEAYDLLMRAVQTDWDIDRQAFNPETNRALALLDRALEIDPNYAHALIARSAVFNMALFFSSDPDVTRRGLAEALSSAERAVKIAPQYANGYASLGWAHFRTRDIAKAEENFIKALELDPRLPYALQGLGLLTIRHDPQSALELFKQAQEIDPQNSFVYRQQYFALDALGRLDDGIATLWEGVERFPEEALLKADLARLYLRSLGQPAEAARLASRILEDDGHNRLGLTNMVDIWRAAGDAGRSAAWFDLFAVRFPGSIGVPLDQAALLLDYGDTAEARAVLESAEETPSFRFDRSTSIGGVCLIQGDVACLEEHANRISAWLDEYEAISRTYDYDERYRIAVAILRNATLPLSDRNMAELQMLLDESEGWPITGGRGNRYAGYLRVMLQSLLGNDNEAAAELFGTLALANDGFLYRDIFRLSPNQNPLIIRLSGEPDFKKWLTEISGRREQARGELVQMERDNVILSASDVAP
jgi:TolB-like protein/Tfp pilus assembly protein PilF